MTIEKVTPNFLKHSEFSHPFTIVLNETIDAIPDDAALGIYLYLARKPDQWQIWEADIMTRFGRGRDHVRKCLKILKEIGLLEKRAVRDEKGHIKHWETILHRQIPDNQTSSDIQITENPTCGVNQILDNPTHIKERSLQKKEVNKKACILSVKTDDLIKEVISIWNELATPLGCRKMLSDKRQLKEIVKNIKIIKENWSEEFNASNFRIWLENAIEKEFYMICKNKQRLDICLRWQHFDDALYQMGAVA